MANHIKPAQSVLKDKRDKNRERRLEDICDYIEEHPGVTAYELVKVNHLKLKKETTRQDLIELERKGDIIIEEEEVEGRIRKKAFLRPLNQYYFTTFEEEELELKVNRKSIKRSQEAGYEITIIMKDKRKIKILPNESLVEKLGK